MKLSFLLTVTDSNRRQTIHVAFCFPFSYAECQRMLNKLEVKHSSEVVTCNSEVPDESCEQSPSCTSIDNEIYFHRELLCCSIENRRIDLITVSSWDGISEEREPRLPGLFPDLNCVRARAFPGKKVFYVTGRVHPGESPSSHVFNGFLQFILRPDDLRAQVLRRHFVFKLIPMLNPDGVFHGHYRTDTRGMNLNRVYLDPSPDLHPSIFAARSLLLYHHKKGTVNNSIAEARTEVNVKQQPSRTCNCASSPKFNGNKNRGKEEGGGEGSGSKLLLVSEKGCSCVCSFSSGLSGWCGNDFVTCRSGKDSNSNLKQNGSLHSSSMNALLTSPQNHYHIPLGLGCSTAAAGNKMTSSSPALLTNTMTQHEDNVISSHQSPKTMQHNHKCGYNSVSIQDKKAVVTNNTDSHVAILATKQSGIAFYVDLHAHATKRGVFMYGNYFSNAVEQAENMLFPKLVSLNSPHLDFEHCVFSEKNMYTADKRDGLSKEGSGRVAMHKATGLIHCYTLECNYNGGRHSNALTAATLDNGRASPPLPPSPMGHRFSIQDFEQVGRALAVSALDMYQLNPWSRLPTTEYSSLAGVRQSLQQRIRNSRSKKNVSSKKSATQCAISNLNPISCDSAPSSMPQANGNPPGENPCTSSWGDGPSQSGASSLSMEASVQACKVLLLQRQKALAAIKGSRQIAADVARLSEAKRKPHCNKHEQPKVGMSPYVFPKCPTPRSTTVQRRHLEKQGQVKPSSQQEAFPLCMPLSVQTDERELSKKSLALVGSKINDEHTSTTLSLPNTTHSQDPEVQHTLKLSFKGRKLLNRKTRNVLLKQSHSRSIAFAQKNPQEIHRTDSQLAVSDSEIICNISRPARFQLRHRAFTSTQIRH